MTARVRYLFACVAGFALALLLVAPSARASERRLEPWPERVLDLAGSLPIQDGGRVKPLASAATFALLRLSGRSRLETRSGEPLDATAWILDVLLFPESAADEPLFLVADVQAVEAIGVERGDKKKRDRWSYTELQPGLPRLFGLAHDYGRIDAKARTSVQAAVVRLADDVFTFLRWARALDFARRESVRVANPALATRLGASTLSFDQVVARSAELARLSNDEDERVARDAAALLEAASTASADSSAVAWFPPASTSEPTWLSPADLLAFARLREPPNAAQLAALADLVALVTHKNDAAAMERALERLHSSLTVLDLGRGELENVALERVYYRLGLLRWSLALYVVAFAVAALSWLRPQSRAGWIAPFTLASAATSLAIAAIAIRCVLRGRPPVSTLYETVLFVTACGSALALVVEWVTRRRIVLAIAALFGAAGLFLANGYERLDAQDTMPSLVAVLDTNFWLATHVTTITLGYTAGMLAAVTGSAFVVLCALRGERFGRESRAHLARTTYGIVCFALVFSIVGTILGGIWANESWGRFWGWDPKENGALLIVISQLVIVHARRAGLVRELGTCTAAAFGGSVVAFSWWGVNLLGVGLHSYGFTSGVQRALWTYDAIQWSVVALGGWVAWRERRAARSRPLPTVVRGESARREAA